MNTHAIPPQARAMQIVQLAVSGKLLAALTQAGVPDVLADRPCLPGEIAARTGLNEDALFRALRAAAQLGVFARDDDGRWRNGEIGEALRADAPGSIRDYVVYALHDGNWRAWQHLDDALRSGKPSFAAGNEGLGFWAYLDAHADLADAFHRAMTATAALTARALPPLLNLARYTRIADIGGGAGLVLAELLKAEPHLHGFLFDRADAIASARDRFAVAGLLDRMTFESGDLFDRIPEGADAYILKNILHDHDEQNCARILDNLHAAMPRNATLFVIEAVLPEGAAPHPAIWRDMHMMVALGGRERKASEWRALFDRHGFTITAITPMPGPDAVIALHKNR